MLLGHRPSWPPLLPCLVSHFALFCDQRSPVTPQKARTLPLLSSGCPRPGTWGPRYLVFEESRFEYGLTGT